MDWRLCHLRFAWRGPPAPRPPLTGGQGGPWGGPHPVVGGPGIRDFVSNQTPPSIVPRHNGGQGALIGNSVTNIAPYYFFIK
jgi:hypothetical protein